MEFSKETKKQLEQNPNVLYVLQDKVFYAPSFKQKAIQEYEEGKTARQIFIEAGFNLSEISNLPDYASRNLSKWRKSQKKNNIHFSQKIKKKNKQIIKKWQQD